MAELEYLAQLQAQARAARKSLRRSHSRTEIHVSRSMSPGLETRQSAPTDELWSSPLTSPDDSRQRARTLSPLREPVRTAPRALQRRGSTVRPYEPGADDERVSAGVDEVVHDPSRAAASAQMQAARPSSAVALTVRPTSAATCKKMWRTSIGFAGSVPAVPGTWAGGRGRQPSLTYTPVTTPSLAGAPMLKLQRSGSPPPSSTDWKSSKAFGASTPVLARSVSDGDGVSDARAGEARSRWVRCFECVCLGKRVHPALHALTLPFLSDLLSSAVRH